MEKDPVWEWQMRNLPALKRMTFRPPCTPDVTMSTSWLWRDERFDSMLDCLLAAILMTWRACGRLPMVLVTNRETPALRRIVDEWGLRLHLAPQLAGGSSNARSVIRFGIEENCSLFDTTYLLSFQHHAFPLRPGLEAFLGKYDCIAAPWPANQDDWITRLLLWHRLDVGNGAFTLRTRHLYETIAWYYRRKYKYLPHSFLTIDDYFIAKTLPSFEKKYRETIRIAPPEVAATFALENDVHRHAALKARPWGFHGPDAFRRLLAEGQVPEFA